MLECGKVRLRAVAEGDTEKMVEWRNDPDVTRWMGKLEPVTAGQMREEISKRGRDAKSGTDLFYAVTTRDSSSPCCWEIVGTVGLHAIDRTSGTCELGVMIGEKGMWGRGLGSDAIGAVLAHAFGDLRLHRVELTAFVENCHGVRCYERAGFVKEGVKRQAVWKHGSFHDLVVMSCLAPAAVCPATVALSTCAVREGTSQVPQTTNNVCSHMLGFGNVWLRPLDEETDVKKLFEWWNDPEVTRWMPTTEPRSVEEEQGFVKSIREASKAGTDLVYAIMSSQRFVGTVGLHRITRTWGSCELGIIIGEKYLWGQGLGSDAIRAVLRHAFDNLRLHRVELRTFSSNTRGLRCYTRVGFRPEATIRQALFKHGQHHDVILMSRLSSDSPA